MSILYARVHITRNHLHRVSRWHICNNCNSFIMCRRYAVSFFEIFVLTCVYIVCPSGCATCTLLDSCQTCMKGYKLSSSTSASEAVSESIYTSAAISNIVCIPEISAQEAQQIKTTATASSAIKSTGSTVAKSTSLFNFLDPSALYLGAFANMLSYMKYLNITYPPKLQLTIDSEAATSFNLLPDIPDALANKFSDVMLPGRFEQTDLQASFFVNFWTDGLMLSIILVVLVLTYILVTCTVGLPLIHKLCDKIIEVLKWNFLFMTLLSYAGDIILFTSMELRTTQLDDTAAIFSFTLCIAINIATVTLLLRLLYIVYQLQNTQQSLDSAINAQQMQLTKNYYKDYAALFESSSDVSGLCQAFTCIYCIYLGLFYAIIAFLFTLPLFQTVLHLLLSSLFLGYLIACWPFKKTIDVVKMVLQQMVMITINASVFGLAYLDNIGSDDENLRVGFGNTVTMSNMVYSSMSMAYSVVTII